MPLIKIPTLPAKDRELLGYSLLAIVLAFILGTGFGGFIIWIVNAINDNL